MGGHRVLTASLLAKEDNSLLVHAFCARSDQPAMHSLGVVPGDVAVVLLNLNHTTPANVTLGGITGPRFTWYVRAATPGVITSADVALRTEIGWTTLGLDNSGQLPMLLPFAEPDKRLAARTAFLRFQYRSWRRRFRVFGRKVYCCVMQSPIRVPSSILLHGSERDDAMRALVYQCSSICPRTVAHCS